MIADALPQDIVPDASFLPPVDEWTSISPEKLEEANAATRKTLNNGNLSPGAKTYLERRNELSIDNTAAFRTIRRIPPPTGETAARLGNAYEFFKNLEFFSGYWLDTSLPPEAEPSSSGSDDSRDPEKEELPHHLRTHVRTGTGAQLPQDYRQQLLTAFIKLVAYDFGCNVTFPRCEPRLHLTPPLTSSTPPSYFNSSATFIYRTPTDRASARTGIVEGPVAAVSCRASTVFATEAESHLDFAREVVAILLTAQQRAREHKAEKRFGEGKWWTTTPRWGGGPGGPIGRETDKVEELGGSPLEKEDVLLSTTVATGEKVIAAAAAEARRAIGGINGPSPSKRNKKSGSKGGNLQIYDNYRKMLPPSSSWDRKAKYCTIGKVNGQGSDDVFLVSALNHHVSIIRARVPDELLDILDGGDGMEWERVDMWRSKWYDLFLAKDRIEAMQIIWGMISYLMRKIEEPKTALEPDQQAGEGGENEKMEKMDLS